MNINGSPDLAQDKSLAAETRYVNLKINLKKLMSDNNLNAPKLSKATGIPKSTLSDWLVGNSPKNIVQVKTVAEFLKVSVDDLVFGDSKKIKTTLKTEPELINFGNFDVYLKKRE